MWPEVKWFVVVAVIRDSRGGALGTAPELVPVSERVPPMTGSTETLTLRAHVGVLDRVAMAVRTMSLRWDFPASPFRMDRTLAAIA